MFFEDRWRLCRGDVRREAIPASRCSHSEDSIADCFQSGTPDDQFVTRRRSESLTWVIVNSPLQVSLSPGILVPYGAIAAGEHVNGQTERNTFWDAHGLRSQCRSRSRGVIWSYFRPLHTNLAAALSTAVKNADEASIPMRFTLPSSRGPGAVAPMEPMLTQLLGQQIFLQTNQQTKVQVYNTCTVVCWFVCKFFYCIAYVLYVAVVHFKNVSFKKF